MADTPESNGLRLALGSRSLSARGPTGIILVLIGLIGGLIYLTMLQQTREHRALESSFDRLTCVLAIPQEARPAALRTGDVCEYARALDYAKETRP